MEGLTDRQAQVLRFFVGYSLRHLAQPTIRAVGAAFGIRSTNGVNDHLKALARKGYLMHGGGRGTRRDVGLTRRALLFARDRMPECRGAAEALLTLWQEGALAEGAGDAVGSLEHSR